MNYEILWNSLKETFENEITRLARGNGSHGSNAVLDYHIALLKMMNAQEEKMRSNAEVTK